MADSPPMPEHVGGRVALAKALFRIGALRFGKFTLASGGPSSYRLDLSVVPSDSEAYGLAIAACVAAAKDLGEDKFDAVAGAGTGGVALSAPMAYLLKKPMLCVRGEGEGNGLGQRVEGAVRPGWRSLVIEDHLTTGRNVVSAVEALRKSGCVVKDALVLVDRLEGGRAALKKSGVALWSFSDIRDLVETLFGEKMITKGDREAVARQMDGPRV